MPPVLMSELQKLCDDVPSFSNEEARKLFKDELGYDFDSIFSELSENPVSAASIG